MKKEQGRKKKREEVKEEGGGGKEERNVRQRAERDRGVNSFMMIALDGMGIDKPVTPHQCRALCIEKSGDDTCEGVNRACKEGE